MQFLRRGENPAQYCGAKAIGAMHVDADEVNCLVQKDQIAYLDLSYNDKLQFDDIQWESFKSLHALLLEGCKLKPEAVERISKLPIQRLKLSYAKGINDRCLEALPKITDLQELDLSGCDNPIKAHELAECRQLRHLFVTSSLADFQLGKLGRLSHLESLRLYKLYWTGLSGFHHLPGLKHLNLVKVGLKRAAFCRELAKLTRLARFALYDAGWMQATHLASFSRMPQLRYLSLHDAKRLDDHGLKAIAQNTSLAELVIQGAPFHGDGFEDLGDAHRLQIIRLSDCVNLSDDALRYFANLPSLTRLIIKNNGKITAEGMAAITDCRQLEELVLHDCPIDKIGFTALAQLKNLKHLQLRFCENVDDNCISQLKQLPALQTLVIEWGNLSDACINDLVQIKTLRHLSITSHNPFSTESAKALNALTDLAYLHLPFKDEQDQTALMLQMPKLQELFLPATIDDMAEKLAAFEKLKKVQVTHADDRLAEQLADIESIEELEFVLSSLSVDALEKLAALPRLRRLVISEDSQMPPQALGALCLKYPWLEIVNGWQTYNHNYSITRKIMADNERSQPWLDDEF